MINLVDSGTAITPNQVVSNLSTAVTTLYDAGGRTFLVPNLPPLGFKPNYVFDPAKRDAANAFVDSFNPLLNSEINLLLATLTGSTIIYLDIHTTFMNAIEDPAAFGLTNVDETAYIPFPESDPLFPYGSVVENPNEYLFWDDSHGTSTTNSIINEVAYRAVVPEPSTSMFLLFTALLFVARRHLIRKTR